MKNESQLGGALQVEVEGQAMTHEGRHPPERSLERGGGEDTVAGRDQVDPKVPAIGGQLDGYSENVFESGVGDVITQQRANFSQQRFLQSIVPMVDTVFS